jgi:hypothetical protein
VNSESSDSGAGVSDASDSAVTKGSPAVVFVTTRVDRWWGLGQKYSVALKPWELATSSLDGIVGARPARLKSFGCSLMVLVTVLLSPPRHFFAVLTTTLTLPMSLFLGCLRSSAMRVTVKSGVGAATCCSSGGGGVSFWSSTYDIAVFDVEAEAPS